MWITRGLRIVPFLNRFIQIARADGYEYIAFLVARPADDYLLYEKLFRDWTSIHHLTGSEIMFLFVGQNAAHDKEPAGFLARDKFEEDLYFSPYVMAGFHDRKNFVKHNHPERMMNGYSYARLTENVESLREFEEIVRSHESQIKELRKRFSLTEAELPALVLLSLVHHKEITVSIREVTSLYDLLKHLVDETEKYGNVKEKLRKVELAQRRLQLLPEFKFYLKRQKILENLNTILRPLPDVLKNLQSILEEPLPWDRRLKSKILQKKLYAIKLDADAMWYYHKHRGEIQSLIYFLQLDNDPNEPSTNSLNLNALEKLMLEKHELEKELAEISNEILDRALQNYLQDEYRKSDDTAEIQIKAPDVFISYSRADIEKARLVENYLKEQGYNVWRDDAIRTGYSFRAEIRAALLSAKSIIVLWTKNSIKSEWVEWEAGMAHRRNRLIPICDDTVSAYDLPAPFGNLQILNFQEKAKLVTHIQRITADNPNKE